jgi:osmotically-inducible protein OsmY
MNKGTDPSRGDLRDRDDKVAEQVSYALEVDVVVPSERIRATVSDGVVTLAGTVDLWRQYDDAERAVRSLPNVRDVRNELDVEALPRTS